MAEHDAQLWVSVPPAGHSDGTLNSADSITLRTYNITRIGNLLNNNEDFPGFNLRTLPIFPNLQIGHPQIVIQLEN